MATQELLNRKKETDAQQHLVFLKLRQVCNRIGYKKSWLWDAVKNQRFPAPIRIGGSGGGGGSQRWTSESVENWMREQIERNQKAAS